MHTSCGCSTSNSKSMSVLSAQCMRQRIALHISILALLTSRHTDRPGTVTRKQGSWQRHCSATVHAWPYQLHNHAQRRGGRSALPLVSSVHWALTGSMPAHAHLDPTRTQILRATYLIRSINAARPLRGFCDVGFVSRPWPSLLPPRPLPLLSPSLLSREAPYARCVAEPFARLPCRRLPSLLDAEMRLMSAASGAEPPRSCCLCRQALHWSAPRAQ
jgi:hypothetical protein